jgi:glycosyltransferase involved in cell wall biosynthesis
VQRDLLDVGIAHGQIDLIANGVEQVILPPREEARRALQLSGGEKVALLLGGLVAGKAPLLAKSAIERCKGWRLLVAGDGPLRDAIRGNSVRAVGFLEDPRLAFAAADLLLHPSYQESFGLAPLEGLAAGLPVVARAGSGLEDLLPPAPLATLVHGDSPQAWASAVECAGSLRSETLAGERRSWVATLFDANRCARAYEDLFAGRAEGKG